MDNYGESNRLQVTNPDTLPISTSELFLLLGKVIVRPMTARHTGLRGCFIAAEAVCSGSLSTAQADPKDCVGRRAATLGMSLGLFEVHQQDSTDALIEE